jgi:enolase
MRSDSRIVSVTAREIIDSRGVPTIEVEVHAGGGVGISAAPFGAPGSRGEFEASAYGQLGLTGGIEAVRSTISSRLAGMDAADLASCDAALRDLDGTPNFERIGGNTSSAVSTSVAKAAASALKVPLHRIAGSTGAVALPLPLGNIIGGGAHALGPTPDMQEHLVIPVSATTVREAVTLNIALHEEAGRVLVERDPAFTGGCDDERGWAANLDDVQSLEVIEEAARRLGEDTGARFRLGLDLAADRFWDKETGTYRYHRSGLVLTPSEQIDFVESLVRRFQLGYVEDAFESTDYESFAELTRRVGDDCLICGDDLYATNTERLAEGTRQGSANSMIIKVNQVGTVSDARATNQAARDAGLVTVISHRSGETSDDSIAHFGSAWNCSMIKTGVLGGERMAKLNELIRLEESEEPTSLATLAVQLRDAHRAGS